MGNMDAFEQLGEQFRELAERVAVLERGQGGPTGGPTGGGFWRLVDNAEKFEIGDRYYDK